LRYFFDAYDGEHLIPDVNGIELPNLATARAEVQRALPDMAGDALPNGKQRTLVASVRDEAGQAMLRAVPTPIFDEGPSTFSNIKQ
jgi:hypothetical protein